MVDESCIKVVQFVPFGGFNMTVMQVYVLHCKCDQVYAVEFKFIFNLA